MAPNMENGEEQEGRIEKEQVLDALRRRGPEDPTVRALVVQWTMQREAAVYGLFGIRHSKRNADAPSGTKTAPDGAFIMKKRGFRIEAVEWANPEHVMILQLEAKVKGF